MSPTNDCWVGRGWSKSVILGTFTKLKWQHQLVEMAYYILHQRYFRTIYRKTEWRYSTVRSNLNETNLFYSLNLIFYSYFLRFHHLLGQRLLGWAEYHHLNYPRNEKQDSTNVCSVWTHPLPCTVRIASEAPKNIWQPPTALIADTAIYKNWTDINRLF